MTTSHAARGLQQVTPERRKPSLFKTSLFKAEWLQFRRNKTLLFMATVFPVGIPLLIFFIGSGGAAESANSFDYFV
ncbi:MAG: ABC transporter permease, partial [Corynebacterium glutamicum]|nr:ABC transporter permease [Corynebacterium glutamicum]